MNYNHSRVRAERATGKPYRAAEGRPVEPGQHYPRAMYRRVSASTKHPHGYEVCRVESPAEEESLDQDWKRSADEL